MLQPIQQHEGHPPLPDTLYQQVFESNAPRQVLDREPLLIDALNPERFLAFQDLKSNVRAVAAEFRGPSFQLNEGDVVAILSPNDIELVTAIHGTMAAGCTALMLSIIFSRSEIEAIFSIASPKLIIVHAQVLDRFETAMKGIVLKFKLPIVVIGTDSKGVVDNPSPSHRRLSDYYNKTTSPDPPSVHPDTTAFLVCTSGSTGPRKLVDITHRISVFRTQDFWDYSYQHVITPTTIVLSSSSFSFIYSFMTYVNLYVQYGIPQYVLPTDDLDALFGAIERFCVTFTSLLSSKHVATIARDPAVAHTYDLSSLTVVRTGGQILSDETILAASKALSANIQNVYGSSEISAVFESDGGGCRFRSLHRKVRLYDDRFVLKLVDEEGQPVPQGVLGELWYKSPAIARGYYNNPKKTAEAFDRDGFYHTGDIFYLDANQNYVIQGRKSDIIKTVDKYYSPRPIEEVCLSFGGISQCAVVGAYNAKVAYEVPRAYIVPHDPDSFPSSRVEEFVQYVNARVPDKAMALTGGAKVLSMLPYTSSNKLDMYTLRAWAQKELEDMADLK